MYSTAVAKMRVYSGVAILQILPCTAVPAYTMTGVYVSPPSLRPLWTTGRCSLYVLVETPAV